MVYIKIQKDIYVFEFIVGMNLVASHHTIHDVIKMGNIVVKKTVIKWLVRQNNDRYIYIYHYRSYMNSLHRNNVKITQLL